VTVEPKGSAALRATTKAINAMVGHLELGDA